MKSSILDASARLFITAGLIGFAGITSAEAMGKQESMYQKLDTDGDGLITEQEATANAEVAKKFTELDANEDGALSEGEFARFEAEGAPEKESDSMEEDADHPMMMPQ